MNGRKPVYRDRGDTKLSLVIREKDPYKEETPGSIAGQRNF